MSVQAALNPFTNLRLNRITERRHDAASLHAMETSSEARYLLLDPQGKAFFHRQHNKLRWLHASERAQTMPPAQVSLLGLFQQRPCFLLALENDETSDGLAGTLNARRLGLREAGMRLAADEAGLFAYAKSLLHWQQQTRYCVCCGASVRRDYAGHRLQCMNPNCGQWHFPHINPAIIVLVEHHGACLLGQQVGRPAGRYSPLAGFVEPGESLEDAVYREVAEESGVIVDQVHYHSSQPWPMPASLMSAFTATALKVDIQLHDGELEDVRWFTPLQIIEGLASGYLQLPSPLSVSYRLLADWLQQHAAINLDEQVRNAPVRDKS